MKKLLLVIASLLTVVSLTNSAESAVILSTSNANATAGSNLTLEVGTTGKLYIWTSTKPGQTLQALSLNITSSNPAVLQGTGSLVYNPTGRWLQTAAGTLGDLVTNQRAATIGAGVSTPGHSIVIFSSVKLALMRLQKDRPTFRWRWDLVEVL